MADDKTIPFTETQIMKLAVPATGRLTYHDSRYKEFIVRVTHTGTKSFYVYQWSSALQRPMRVFLGKWPSLSVEKARELARKRIGAIADGEDPRKQKLLARDALTLDAAIKGYFESLKKAERKETTLALYRYLAERYLAPWNSLKLGSITAERILSLRQRVRDQDGSRAIVRDKGRKEKSNRTVSANRVVRLLSQIFNHAISSGWVGANPCHKVKPFPEKSATRRLSDSEIGPFITACEALAEQGDQIGDYLLVCLFSGIRRRNVASARWEHVDLERGVWDVPETKNGLPVRVYLTGKLLEALKRCYERREFAPYVFPSADGRGCLSEPRKGLARVLALANPKPGKAALVIDPDGLTIHALKHTFVSCAYECGLNPVVVSRLGGHKISGITGRYGHTSDEKVRDAYATVERYLCETISRQQCNVIRLQS